MKFLSRVRSYIDISLSICILLSVIGITVSTYGSNTPHPIKSIMRQHIDNSPSETFRIWHYLHKREYNIDSSEGLQRFHNFKKNLEIVKSHNSKTEKNYSIGLNNFADMTLDEFHQQYLKGNAKMFRQVKDVYDPQKSNSDSGKNHLDFWDLPEEEDDTYFELFLKDNFEKKKQSGFLLASSPHSQTEFSTIDWIEKAQLRTPVENQGNCGSCWAFASSQAIQAAYTIKTGKPTVFSKQQLIDCESQSSGCNGGLLHTAMDYIKINGIEEETEYPYEMSAGQCRYKSNKLVTQIKSYEACMDDEKCTDKSLFNTLSKGPVAAVVDASEEFMLYEEGVFDKPCTEANHAILVVGYHKGEGDSSYWVIKNSWGETWGDHGFIKIKHSKDYNSCLLNIYYVRPEI